ncbi:MAG: hypothetical protein QOG15_1487 [Solirubrobacteraceae bacterium]|jgi:hypothetical protein|nr:hypothetical protein [Solirubrobacteraceae bacterium]
MRTAPTCLVALLVATCLTVWVGGALDVPVQAAPRCFGAAARDHEHPCTNRALNVTVTPAPSRAAVQADPPCTQIKFEPSVCAFGRSRTTAKKTVALMGDSHARHWRAAMLTVAARRGWRVLSIYKSTCPYTFASFAGRLADCAAWSHSVAKYLAGHPEIHTVFVSGNTGFQGGGSFGAAKVKGFLDAWKGLPPSVTEVFDIHDVPHAGRGTRRCVEAQIRLHHNAGVRCKRPRSRALHADYLAVAAEQSATDKVRLIDLTSFMCGSKNCFPVIGGVLVIKDIGHLTRTFSRTLGPYLDRAITAARKSG